MVLSGLYSNQEFQGLLQSLTSRATDQAVVRRSRRQEGWPDGRRAFGTVRNAIVAVLAEAGCEMKVKAVHTGVEQLLGKSVSRHSVSGYLAVRARGSRPLFERTHHGHYRLL